MNDKLGVVPSCVLFAVVYIICDHAQENLAQLRASKYQEKIDILIIKVLKKPVDGNN